jgi:2-dehydro-3-deoxyphosphogluconate aldolase/(4S)-4-hydroxy-2-oxoglutarate aldolase
MTTPVSVFEQLGRLRLIPVITLDAVEHAEPLGSALLAGGLPCAEITLRTAAALPAIEVMASQRSIIVGAGTVRSVEQVKQAVDRGAQFIVAPGFNPRVVRYCVEEQIPIVPGVCTPTDIEGTSEFGLEVLKFFPAEAFGGIRTLSAISAPYANLRFIPTGGISASNLSSYLALPSVLACGGSWMVSLEFMAQGHFDEITRRVRDAVALTESIHR